MFSDRMEKVVIYRDAEFGCNCEYIKAIFCEEADKKYFITFSKVRKDDLLKIQGECIKAIKVDCTHISIPCSVNAYTVYYEPLSGTE